MRVRVRSWGLGVASIGWAASVSAQTAAAQFPPEPAAASAATAPAAAAAPPVSPNPTQPAVAAAPATQPVTVVPAAAAPTREKPTRNWNVGAGILAGGSFNTFYSRGVPSYHAALERRLGERTWLALNARVSYDSDERLASTLSTSAAGTTKLDMASASVLLGARQVFAEGVVEVSGYAAVMAGYYDLMGDELEATGATAILGGGDGYDLGLLLGFAVERELLDALALRLAIDVVSAKISSEQASKRDDAGVTQTTPLSSARAALDVQPALQLHFYF